MAGLTKSLARLLSDPAPEYIFEISEAGIAYVRPGVKQPLFEPLQPETLHVSPLTDNVLKPDAFADVVRKVVGPAAGRKRSRAVLILPDYCARVAVLEFDQFPDNAAEQQNLVRFRMKKSVPFDVESAVIAYHPQPVKGAPKAVDVVVVAAALEIVARYEAPFRSAGLHPGFVTTSALALSGLNRAASISLIARLSGRVLTVIVMNGPVLKLVRTVELGSLTHEEVMAVLFPTLAYIEDEFRARPEQILVCGLGDTGRSLASDPELDIPVEPLRARTATPDGTDAGLLGYLEAAAEGKAA